MTAGGAPDRGPSRPPVLPDHNCRLEHCVRVNCSGFVHRDRWGKTWAEDGRIVGSESGVSAKSGRDVTGERG